jgi:hypothetical protein
MTETTWEAARRHASAVAAPRFRVTTEPDWPPICARAAGHDRLGEGREVQAVQAFDRGDQRVGRQGSQRGGVGWRQPRALGAGGIGVNRQDVGALEEALGVDREPQTGLSRAR